jgi:hypothetical protein
LYDVDVVVVVVDVLCSLFIVLNQPLLVASELALRLALFHSI